jgi:hypothetical protein
VSGPPGFADGPDGAAPPGFFESFPPSAPPLDGPPEGPPGRLFNPPEFNPEEFEPEPLPEFFPEFFPSPLSGESKELVESARFFFPPTPSPFLSFPISARDMTAECSPRIADTATPITAATESAATDAALSCRCAWGTALSVRNPGSLAGPSGPGTEIGSAAMAAISARASGPAHRSSAAGPAGAAAPAGPSDAGAGWSGIL